MELSGNVAPPTNARVPSPASRWIWFSLRWAIAIAGVAYVLSNITLYDRVTILDDRKHPVSVYLDRHFTETSTSFILTDPRTGQIRTVSRNELVNRPAAERTTVPVRRASQTVRMELLALDLSSDLKHVRRLLVADPATGNGIWLLPTELAEEYQLRVPRPLVEAGILSMIRSAQPSLLWAAMLVFPPVFLIVAYRWNKLLAAIDIHLPQSRTFVLTMVGAFYNSFMPGSTGGDVLKAYYASRQTPHKARAVMSVIVDRAIGLLALIVLGGLMAAYGYFTSANPKDPATVACLQVTLGALAIVVATVLGVLLFHEPIRRRIGLDFVLRRLPAQKLVQTIIHVMSTYRRRPGLVLFAMLITFPVHILIVISAIFAGNAFDLPIPMPYYFVAVPVIVLAGAIPISPQGAGVMEFFAIQLTKQHGTTVSEAFALTMSIRLVQIIWNLVGGIFVLRGGYHAPSAVEQAELEKDEPETAGNAVT